MEKSSERYILESRKELMMSKSKGEPTNRLAHFIKPSETSLENLDLRLPSCSLSKPTSISEPEGWPLEVHFAAWRYDIVTWKEWVGKMALTHKSTWEKAGIFEPIMNSSYQIRKDANLIFGLAEKWSSETNTFVFSWGEVSITLEDMMALGFSVLGSYVSTPLENEELKNIEEKLNIARLEMMRSCSKKAYHSLWLKNFMNSGSEIEHEAFLALWLSRYIFLRAIDTVGPHVFPIAIHLARGNRIALAPAVLASIYRDLGLLRCTIMKLGKKQNNEKVARIAIKSPFHLVQIWAWERFVNLQPLPNHLNDGEPRLARWNKLYPIIKNVRRALESSEESFEWRPYGKYLKGWKFSKFYSENEMLVRVDSSIDEELESFARCLRVTPLVGLDFVEWYFPHRVAMQFGYDQDLPGRVNNRIYDLENGWRKYSRSICDVLLYIPSRNFQANVTTRYAEWWDLSRKSLKVAKERVPKRSLKCSVGFLEKQKRSRSMNEKSKLLRKIIAKCLKQKKGIKNLTNFDRLRSYRSSFSKKRKVSGTMKEDNGVTHPLKIPKVSSRKNSRNGSLTSGNFPSRKDSTIGVSGCLERKMDEECLLSSSLKTSEELENEEVSLVYSWKPDDSDLVSEYEGSKLYRECLKLECRVRKLEKGIKEIKAFWEVLDVKRKRT